MHFTGAQVGSLLEELGTAVFWASLMLLAYTYLGYGMLLRLLPTRHAPSLPAGPFEPYVSILMAAHNEEKALQAKLANLGRLSYPAHLLQIIVVSDGSTDRTEAILEQAVAPHVQVIVLPRPQGKALALNHAAAAAIGDVLVFFDVRQTIATDAIEHLVAPLIHPSVGAVSGELLLEDFDGKPSTEALGIYWRLEKQVRKLESKTGSVVGVTGAIYAMRRHLYLPIPAGTLLDDVLLPMQVARAGFRVLFQPAAIARDRVFPEQGKEFTRKVRTLTGNYQLLQLAPWLLTPSNPLLFRFVSHKVLRLAAPLLLALLLLISALIPATFYRISFLMQLVFYGLALCGAFWPHTRRMKPIAVANTFVMLNLAAARAFLNFVAGRNAWT